MSAYGTKVVAVLDTQSAFGVTIKQMRDNITTLSGQMSTLLADAPETLDTLNEIAAAVSDDPAFFSTMSAANTTLQNNIDALQTATENARTALQTALQSAIDTVQADVDANETASNTATTALSGRLDTLEVDPTTAAAVAAVQADVDQNEADADAAIALRAPLASPTFTGLLTSPAIDLVNDNINQVGLDLHNNISNQYAADVSTNNWGIRVISNSTNAGSSVLDVRTGDGVAFRVDNDRSIHLEGGLTDAADDAAAATAGVGVGQLYRNGSAVMIRVS